MAPFSKASKEKRKERRNHAGKRTKKSKHKALQRDIGRCFKNQSTINQFWTNIPPRRPPGHPRRPKSNPREHQEGHEAPERRKVSTKTAPRASPERFPRKYNPRAAAASPPGRAQKKATFSFCRSNGRVGPQPAASPPLRNPPMMLRKQQ